MNKFLKILAGVSLLILLFPVLLHGQNDIDLMGIKLFESGNNPVSQSERIYSTHFSKAAARYIYYEVEVRNNFYNVEDNNVIIKAKYYKPDGSLFGDPVLDYIVPPDWETAFLWHSWGWNDPGNWETGIYRVVLYIDDTKLAEIFFTIL